MKDYMKTGFEIYAENAPKNPLKGNLTRDFKKEMQNDMEFAEEATVSEETVNIINNNRMNGGKEMKEIKKNTNNPTRKDKRVSIEDIYEMETNNYQDYSTETFESLEFAEDFDIDDNYNKKKYNNKNNKS